MSATKKRSANRTVQSLKSSDCEIAIIGAGPYGLSAAAHLKAAGADICVFGTPMDFWANQMPRGMLLRSPRVASTISDPRSEFTLEAYEAANGIAPQSPLPLETFVNYGRWFRQQLGNVCDSRLITKVTRGDDKFRLQLNDGHSIIARRVVVAAGVGPFARRPNVFESLPADRLSHCYDGADFAELSNKRVAVIGAGQSALESAALLKEASAQVEVIARISQLHWIGQHQWLHRLGPVTAILYSSHDIGPAGISRLVSWPGIVSRIPLKVRDRIRTRAVRPAGAPWLLPRLGGVQLTCGREVVSSSLNRAEVRLKLDDGTDRVVDYVLLGTGYQFETSQYRFLPSALLTNIQQKSGYPALARGFSSSIPGLHFVGAAAAKSFGPLLNFVAGTDYSSSRLAAYICRRGSNTE